VLPYPIRIELLKNAVNGKRQDLVSLLRHNPTLKAFGARMKANGLAPKAVVGAAMRKLAHLIYGVVKSGKPFDANFAINGVAIQDGLTPNSLTECHDSLALNSIVNFVTEPNRRVKGYDPWLGQQAECPINYLLIGNFLIIYWLGGIQEKFSALRSNRPG
jgi:hypothetical protein